MIENLNIFIFAFIVAVIFTIIIRRLAIHYKIVNNPNPIIPQHVKPIAYLGGLAILLALLACGGILFFFFPKLFKAIKEEGYIELPVTIGIIIFTLFGVYDDLKQLKPATKFFLQLIITTTIVAIGLRTNIFGISAIDFVFSVFWILFLVNATNFTDVCDGLVTSIATITFLGISIFHNEINTFPLIFAAILFGFYIFNSPRASIFLGDAGSHLIGFLLAATGIIDTEDKSFADATLWLWLIASIPIFELIFITVIRIKKGLPWWKGSPDHFSLRLQSAGLSRWQVNIIAAVITALTTILACLFKNFQSGEKYVYITVAVIIFLLCWKVLLKYEVKPKKESKVT